MILVENKEKQIRPVAGLAVWTDIHHHLAVKVKLNLVLTKLILVPLPENFITRDTSKATGNAATAVFVEIVVKLLVWIASVHGLAILDDRRRSPLNRGL
jgi:hypothetical protein